MLCKVQETVGNIKQTQRNLKKRKMPLNLFNTNTSIVLLHIFLCFHYVHTPLASCLLPFKRLLENLANFIQSQHIFTTLLSTYSFFHYIFAFQFTIHYFPLYGRITSMYFCIS